jgi:hypothetical protein
MGQFPTFVLTVKVRNTLAVFSITNLLIISKKLATLHSQVQSFSANA